MALNVGLSASARIELLDSLLRHDRWWTREELLREVCKHTQARKEQDVSMSTLRGDLANIQCIAEERLLIDKKERKLAYRYEDRAYSIYNIERPDPQDYDYLQQAIQVLQQVKGFAISEELKSLVVKLKYVMPIQSEVPTVLFDGPDRFEGMELMQQVYDAINKQQVIAFQYQPFNEKAPVEFTLHPYLLKEYNNRWYLVGYAIPQNEIWICALDRFKSDPKPRLRNEYLPPAAVGFDPVVYFADVIGPTVRKENPVEEVVLKFTPNRAPYVSTKKLHSSQELLKTYKDGSVSFTYRLRYNRELHGILMGFASDVKVLKPASLQQKIKDTAEAIVAMY